MTANCAMTDTILNVHMIWSLPGYCPYQNIIEMLEMTTVPFQPADNVHIWSHIKLISMNSFDIILHEILYCFCIYLNQGLLRYYVSTRLTNHLFVFGSFVWWNSNSSRCLSWSMQHWKQVVTFKWQIVFIKNAQNIANCLCGWLLYQKLSINIWRLKIIQWLHECSHS